MISNPWTVIIKGDNIAKIDKDQFPHGMSASQYANAINFKYKEVGLTFSCLPDPFNGNPNSRVYCLCKNPGKPDPCFVNEKAFITASINNLRLKSESCFWAENIRNRCGKLHDGVSWLTKRTKELKMILGRNPDIFFIEFFPYHSTKGFNYPQHLPSYDFSDSLIKQAMEENKLIIIMRDKSRWYKRIEGLDKYPHHYVLKHSQGGYLTLNNIVRYDNGIEKHLSENDIRTYF